MTRARSPLEFFALVFALSIPIWLVEPREWPITAAVGTPLLAGLLLAYRENGSDGVRRLLGRVFDCRRIRNRIWYLPTLLLMPMLSLVSYAVMRLAGLPLRAEPSNLLLAVPAFFALFFILAIGEETGWTGYATDPLLERWGPLTTAVILGVVTSLWHLVPLIRMGRTPEWIAWWMLWSAPQRVFFVWLYTGTGRSLFAAILLHATVNLSVSSPFLPRHGSVLDIAVAAVVTAGAAALVAPRLRSG
jgi:CAAX protease family protein